MGLIKNNFKMIESEKHKDTPQERKLFYQVGMLTLKVSDLKLKKS